MMIGLEAPNSCSSSVHICLLLIIASTCVHRSTQLGTTSTRLKSLLEDYENKLRPYSGGPPVRVDLGLQVESLSSISESTMDFSLTMFLREYWDDPRLVSNSTSHIILKGNDVDLVWAPDIFFLHEKSAKVHDVTVKNKLVYIRPNGSVWLSMRLSATLACHMSLENFPMDAQTCSVRMMSYAYDDTEMKLTLEKDNILIDDKLEIPQFDFLGFEVRHEDYKFATGNFSQCRIILKFERQMQAYLLTVYIPSILLVVIAWLSFWIDARAAPARITLGITTVLTVTTMTSGILETLPIVTYAKAIDIWLAACLLFVFLCLLEYAWANYLMVCETRRNRKSKSKKSKKSKKKREDSSGNDVVPDATTVEMEHLLGETQFTAIRLDKISRYIFPVGFIIFNLVYWPYYLYNGKQVLFNLKAF